MQPQYTPDSTSTKQCPRCKEYFPATAVYFYRDRTRPSGLDLCCKRCKSERKGTTFREHAPSVPEGAKWCRQCGEIKPLCEFHRKRQSADGHNATCKKCMASKGGFRYRPPVPDGYRRCAHCKQELPADTEHFYRDRRYPGGLASWCIICTTESLSEWVRNNQERVFRRQKKWADENREKTRAAARRFYHANKEKYRQYYREHYEAHLKSGRKSYWKNVERSRQLARENGRRWRVNNPFAASAVAERRLARKRALPDNFTTDDWRRCLDYFKGRCAYCGNQQGLFRNTILCIEHFVPLSSPDCAGTVPENILPGCASCNSSKATKPAAVWLSSRYGPHKAAAILKRIEGYFASLAS